LPPLETTLAAPQASETLELDELWSFVGQRKTKRWVWLALCRRTRQVVAYAIGNRGKRTCQRLWERIPHGYKTGLLYTDFWDAYAKVLPASQHRATGKGDGETCHIERFNNVLRQRMARFVRQTLSFSKLDTMHEACLRIFLHEHNLPTYQQPSRHKSKTQKSKNRLN
jgi:insertion element IS1 protein InsB